MKIRYLRMVALITASIINAWLGLILLIIGAHFVKEITDGDKEPLFEFIDIHISLFILLSLFAVVIAWFKNKIGGILISISAIGLIFSNLDDLHFGQWPQYLLFTSGVLLLFFVFYNQWLLKRNNN